MQRINRIERQFEGREVEPNSALGEAMKYFLRHYQGLSTFLRVSGAPLDNNTAERALKRFVLFRKNSLFFKNDHGAAVGTSVINARFYAFERAAQSAASRSG
jgi:transposase